MKICWKGPHPQAIQDVEEVVFPLEKISTSNQHNSQSINLL